MAFQSIAFDVTEGVATLTLARPSKKNAMDAAMLQEIREAISTVRHDRDIHALVLAGAGGAFSSGGDIAGIQAGNGSPELARERMLRQHLWLEELLALDRPVIAAVDGVAYGAGFGFALAADFVLASPRARFCVSFLRLGLIPDFGLLHTLPRAVGVQRAKELMLTTREIGAEEAKQLGIVFEIHDESSLHERAQQLAKNFGSASSMAVSLIKRATNSSPGSSVAEILETEATAQALARSTAYHHDALARMLDRQVLRYPPS